MAKVTSGEILASDLVWKEGMRDWQPAGEIPGLKALMGPSQPMSSPVFPQVDAQPTQSSPMPAPVPAPAPYEMNRPPATSGLAIASLICGILGLVTCFPIFGIPAVICGHLAMHQISRHPQSIPGRGLAIAGLVMGYLSILVLVGLMIFVFFSMVEGSSTRFY